MKSMEITCCTDVWILHSVLFTLLKFAAVGAADYSKAQCFSSNSKADVKHFQCNRKCGLDGLD